MHARQTLQEQLVDPKTRKSFVGKQHPYVQTNRRHCGIPGEAAPAIEMGSVEIHGKTTFV